MKSEKDAWVLAKNRNVAGDDVLYNTLGAARCVKTLVAKTCRAWACESMSNDTLKTHVKFTLDNFLPLSSVHGSLGSWRAGGWKMSALILSGDGDLGKTRFACALMLHVAPARAFHFLNKLDRVRDVVFGPGEGLVVDEVTLAERHIDDVKGLVDLEEGRDIDCRNKDGFIPEETPRILLTNWAWDSFWPREALGSHATPVTRRVLWVNVKKDLRRMPGMRSPVADSVRDEDPFNHSSIADDNDPFMSLPVAHAAVDEDPFGHGVSII